MLWAPYHAFVRSKVRAALASVVDPKARLIDAFAPNAVFRFSGDHALGGTLRGRTQIGSWFDRARRLFPDLRLEPLHIVVNGGPWDTTAATRFRVRATLTNGEAYHNEGMQFLRIALGRIVEDYLYEDTAALERALATLARNGVVEASAQPLGEAAAAAA